MQRPHYHVISGDHEAMPDRNVVYRTMAHARAAMADWKRECENNAWRNIVALPEDERAALTAELGGFPRMFSGTALVGYYECNYPTSIVGLEYIELTTCYEPDCLEGLDDG